MAIDSRSPFSATRRTVVFFALIVLIAAGCERGPGAAAINAEGAKATRPGPPPGKGGAPEGVRGAGEGMAEHPEELKLPPPKGRMLWVVASPKQPAGDGSEERPWNDLQTALRQLKPGDRLVMKPGNYYGPIVIDETVSAGTAEAPIELHAKVNAPLEGRGNEPVLRIAQKGWTLHGLEIIPGKNRAPAVEIAGASDIVISHGHFHDGEGDGVRIEPGSERITFADSHIHIFGPRRGRPDERMEVVGLRIAPGTSDIKGTATKIHNIAGPTLKVMTPEEYRSSPDAKLLPAAKGLSLDGFEQIGNWPERE